VGRKARIDMRVVIAASTLAGSITVSARFIAGSPERS
jgi:hypothetical protein